MISPPINLNFIPPFLSSTVSGGDASEGGRSSLPVQTEDELDGADGLGKSFEVNIEDLSVGGENAQPQQVQYPMSEDQLCHSFGKLLYELISNRPPFTNEGQSSINLQHGMQVPANASIDERSSKRHVGQQKSEDYTSLLELVFPSSLSLLIKNLIECTTGGDKPDDAYPSLKVVSKDIRLLLKYPGRFLFDRTLVANCDEKGSGMLHLRKDKLYGRDKQSFMIMDTFCRVSLTGHSEVNTLEHLWYLEVLLGLLCVEQLDRAVCVCVTWPPVQSFLLIRDLSRSGAVL